MKVATQYKDKTNLSTTDYHKLKDRLSFSALKCFDDSRMKFFKKYILQDKSIEEDASIAMTLGNVVDCLLLKPEEFDSKFSIATCLAPTGQMGLFVEELCKLTLKSLDNDNQVTRDFKDLAEEAFRNVKYDKSGNEVAFKKKDFEWLLNNFIGSEAESYYKDCRSQFGKQVIDTNMLSSANNIVDSLKTCEFTENIVNLQTSEDVEVINQLTILYELDGIPFKSMIDKVVIYHKNMVIEPYDLKVTYLSENFDYAYWKTKYYLQIAIYKYALLRWAYEMDYEKYMIEPLCFIVGDSTLQTKPLLWQTTDIHTDEGEYGFELSSGRKMKGFLSLIKDIKWHLETGTWTVSRENFLNKGICTLRTFEESKQEKE